MIPLVLFAVALLVRAVVGLAFPGPAYPDSYYYAHVAQQIAAGNGFAVEYLWNLDDIGNSAVGSLPMAANGLWMPLAEIVQVPFIWLLGPTSIAAGAPFWLIGALSAPLTYAIGRDAGIQRWQAVAAALLVAVPAGLTPFVSQPDTFALFMLLGSLSLWLCARGLRGDQRSFVLGGLVVGLATLVRTDGALLGIPFALAFAVQFLPRRERVISATAAVGCAALFVIVLMPWLYRQLDQYGSLLPSMGSGRLVWLTDYGQLFSFSNPPTAEAFLAQGASQILFSRIGALLSAVQLLVVLPLAVALAPFVVVGAWVRRNDLAFRPFFVYAVVLLAAMSILFAVLVPHGTFLHAAAALVPHGYILVVVGIAATVDWIARRRPRWNADQARRVFTYGALMIAVIAGALRTSSAINQWTGVRAVQQSVLAALAQVPGEDRVMASDPGAINYLTGREAVLTTHDPLPVVEDVMRQYGVRWLLLERSSIVPALRPLLEGTQRPAWLSNPVAVTRSSTESTATTQSVTEDPPAAALFAVCFDPGDSRCHQ